MSRMTASVASKTSLPSKSALEPNKALLEALKKYEKAPTLDQIITGLIQAKKNSRSPGNRRDSLEDFVYYELLILFLWFIHTNLKRHKASVLIEGINQKIEETKKQRRGETALINFFSTHRLVGFMIGLYFNCFDPKRVEEHQKQSPQEVQEFLKHPAHQSELNQLHHVLDRVVGMKYSVPYGLVLLRREERSGPILYFKPEHQQALNTFIEHIILINKSTHYSSSEESEEEIYEFIEAIKPRGALYYTLKTLGIMACILLMLIGAALFVALNITTFGLPTIALVLPLFVKFIVPVLITVLGSILLSFVTLSKENAALVSGIIFKTVGLLMLGFLTFGIGPAVLATPTLAKWVTSAMITAASFVFSFYGLDKKFPKLKQSLIHLISSFFSSKKHKKEEQKATKTSKDKVSHLPNDFAATSTSRDEMKTPGIINHSSPLDAKKADPLNPGSQESSFTEIEDPAAVDNPKEDRKDSSDEEDEKGATRESLEHWRDVESLHAEIQPGAPGLLSPKAEHLRVSNDPMHQKKQSYSNHS